MKTYHFRFWPASRRRPATCGLCWAMVPKDSVEAHVLWHAQKGEDGKAEPGSIYATHMNVTVAINGDLTKVDRTGWVTSCTGPG